MSSWLLLGALGMIWAAFLVPWKRADVSPSASIEEFERKMSMLEETNKTTPGRWVLMPRKDERFIGPLERARMRVRTRRRLVFMVLLEATVVSLLIGLFPPLRRMLFATAVLAVMLVAYCALLVRIRQAEDAVERRRRARGHVDRPALRPRYGSGRRRSRDEDLREAYEAAGLQVAALECGEHQDDVPVRNLALDDGVQIIEEDVHVVVRRSDRLPTARVAPEGLATGSG